MSTRRVSYRRIIGCLAVLLCMASAWCTARAAKRITVPLVPIYDTATFNFPTVRSNGQSKLNDYPIQYTLPPFAGMPADCLVSGPTCQLVSTDITATYDPIAISIQNMARPDQPATMTYGGLVLYGFGPGYTPDSRQTLQDLSIQAPGSSFVPPHYDCAASCSTQFSVVRTQHYDPSGYALLGPGLYEVRLGAGLEGLATGSITISLTISGTATFLVPDGPPALSLIDPSFSLIDNGDITRDRQKLASDQHVVKGLTADGTSRLVIRIGASYPGEQFTISQPQDGQLVAGPDAADSSPDPSLLSVLASSQAPYYAYVFLYAPSDFTDTGPSQAQSRQLTITVRSLQTKLSTTQAIQVVRPPVVLIHGLWSNANSWNHFTPLLTSSTFDVDTFDYRDTHASSFATNAALFSDYLAKHVRDYARRNQVAASQADVVAHSMGGDIARSLGVAATWTYGRGYIHKLITIGTPHLGSPLARDLLKPENDCIASNLTTAGQSTVGGAIVDLAGNGDGTGLSVALRALRAWPMATLAGRIASSQVTGLGWLTGPYLLGGCNRPNTLADSFSSPDRYGALMGGKGHDGVVPLSSALNGSSADLSGNTWGDGLSIGGKHSANLDSLGFTGPSLLDPDSVLAYRTVDLLNTPVSNGAFHP